MAAADKKSEKQVMDVSKPGKVPAQASARPVIVGHKPQVQDPMVNTAEDTNPEIVQEEPTVDSPASPAASKKVIAPLSELEKPDATETPATDEPATEAAEEETTPAEQTDTPPATEEESSDAAVVDAVAEQVGSKKKEEEQQSEEDKKRQAELEKLVLEKKYFVPIGKAHRKSNRRILAVTIFLFVVLVGLLGAIDAGVLDAGFGLPVDIIPN